MPAVGRLADFQQTWRETAGLIYDDLAEATGWSASTLRNAASGQRPPRQDVLPWGRDQTDGPCPPSGPRT
ncbi:helix-turn-helix transcriptional regulator [Streptomyces phaeochromogenes]|uniref:helix-turn-helix domain-containing protein n=1 Tax=Streptomyces phaeochromogenes TaxID=1923 RepID=UPI0033D9BDB1